MTDEPTIRQIIKKGPRQFMSGRERFDYYLLRVVALGLVILAVVLFTVRATSSQAKDASDKANEASALAIVTAQGNCQVWHDLASIPLTPSTGTVGLQLIADFRIAYSRQDCASVLGELPAPDDRIRSLLPPGVK